MSKDIESINLSLSFLEKGKEELSQSCIDDISFLKEFVTSLDNSLHKNHSLSEIEFLAQKHQNEISFDLSEPSINTSSMKKREKISDFFQTTKTLPTGRLLKKNNLNFSNFVTSNKLFCKFCEDFTVSIVHYQNTKDNWWDSVITVLSNLKCCSEQKKQTDYILVHKCKSCGNILAKIYTSQPLQEVRENN